MSLFRSDRIGFFTLMAPLDFSWEVLNELGELDALQFLDLNAQETSFKRPYTGYLKQCEDLETKISAVEAYTKRFGKEIVPCENYREFTNNLKQSLAARHQAEKMYLFELENEVNQQMELLNQQIKAYEDLVAVHNHLAAYREVLIKTKPYIGTASNGELIEPRVSLQRGVRFTYLAGIINKEDTLRFRRILFRVTRGNAWTALIDIDRANNEDDKERIHHCFMDSGPDTRPKTVFLIVYLADEGGRLKEKLNKVCESFGASKYGVPEDPVGFGSKLMELEGQLTDSFEVLQQTRTRLEDMLEYWSLPASDHHSYSHIEGLKLYLLRQKTVFTNLNMLQAQTNLIQGHCWCPLDRVGEVRNALVYLGYKYPNMGSCQLQEAPVPAGMSPPTAFRTNDVTGVFQDIVNTYGIPRYREINPGLFTIATFPFLFGVMFGDIAHGGLLLVAGLYLVFWKNSIEENKQSLWKMLLPARYLLALQGFFALYCGLIYNDFTSIPFNLFGSCYGEADSKEAGCTYPFGLDPKWYGASNELTFINSFKMKLAVILGVTHMMFGIVLRGVNSVYTRKWLDFFFEFLPMLVFMGVTFGYMVFLIFLKWSLPWGTDSAYTPESAPSIIGIFIKMALSPGHWDITLGRPLFGDDGTFQAKVQLVFLFTAVMCALLILVPKPLILWSTQRKKTRIVYDYTLQESDYNITESLLNKTDVDNNQILIDPQPKLQKQLVKKVEQGETQALEEHFDMGEILVHQVIETIEFVLGSISNTASYLRLWALSLAHSQLAKVFFDNTLGYSLASGNFIMVFFTFWIFANISLGVLMLMDQLECFLHALRLHWVEFQNKFYKADGYAFAPLSFEKSFKKYYNQ